MAVTPGLAYYVALCVGMVEIKSERWVLVRGVMNMANVVIIGGGFGGLACVGVLRRCKSINITVLDRKETSDFLPLLPDIIGGRISPEAARVPLPLLAKRHGFRFVQDEVRGLDLEQHHIHGSRGEYTYDYLVIAAGSETNFYDLEGISRMAFKLDDVKDAERISAVIDEDCFQTIVVAGGGYTGVEIATNLRHRFAASGRQKSILIVEATQTILSTLPEWMRAYAENNLARMNVNVVVNSRIQSVAGTSLVLSNGQRHDHALLIWAAGVQTPLFVRNMKDKKTRQGRLETYDSMRLDPRVYVVGDSATVPHAGQPLRMAVQFAITQGRCAGRNILRSLRGKCARPCRPHDLGYVIPMANLRSCGRVMGLSIRGVPASLLHYMMCIYRSSGPAQKARVLTDLIKNAQA